jgi:large repetitive protein
LTEVAGNIIKIFKAIRNLRMRLHLKKLAGVGFWMLGAIILPVSITQPASPLLIISQPLPQTDCYGNHVEFSVAVTGSAGIVHYQWQERPPGGEFSDITGATSALLSIDNIGVNSQNVNGTEYRVLITDDNGTITSDPALLSINSITSLTPVVVNSVICNGGGITYSVFTEGNVSSNGYRWAWNNGSGWNYISDGGAYSGTTTSRLTISNATPAQNGSYRVSVTFSTLNQPPSDPTCIETSFTRERNIVVREPLIAPKVSSSQQICYGNIPSTLIATAASGGSGPDYTYQWQSSTDGASWIDIPGENLLSFSPPALTSGSFYRIAATDGGTPHCGTVYSGSVLITVSPLPSTSSIYHN